MEKEISIDRILIVYYKGPLLKVIGRQVIKNGELLMCDLWADPLPGDIFFIKRKTGEEEVVKVICKENDGYIFRHFGKSGVAGQNYSPLKTN